MTKIADIAIMKMMLSLESQMAEHTLGYTDDLLMVGSCFSDNIGVKLQAAKFKVLYNPTGIVFDPLCIANHLEAYIVKPGYKAEELVFLNGLWHSWLHHSDCSSPEAETTLLNIHTGIGKAHQQLATASHLFITLGTAFSYRLKETNMAVANCHKAPGDWFEKRLLPVEEMVNVFQQSLEKVFVLNEKLQVVFTVSPVKHIRDGIIENNWSKSRLLETAHALTLWDKRCTYFPAFELVNDVLRDYRFYTTDMAHPSAQAIDFVFDFFCKTYLTRDTQQLMQEVLQIVSARNHKVSHPESSQHQQFLKNFLAKTEVLRNKLPMLEWREELVYFGG